MLNSTLSEVIAQMGHGDTLVIGDAGLPIPPGIRRIDLAVSRGTPSLLAVLDAVLSEWQIESAQVADALLASNPALFNLLQGRVGHVKLETLPHAELKTATGKAVAVVRTGECTPWANIILRAGVVF